MINLKRRVTAFVLLLAVVFTSFFTGEPVQAAGIAKPGDKATVKNVLQIAEKYDPDAEYILRKVNEHGSDILFFLSKGLSAPVYSSNVHEMLHIYCAISGGVGTEGIYLGNQETLFLKYYQDFFPTSEATEKLADNLRTSRFSEYVSETSVNSGARKMGLYGLLDEFTAYWRGTETELRLSKWLEDTDAGKDLWLSFASGYQNGRQAYREFRLWILTYILYAKENYPEVYKEIMGDKDYIKAYCTVDNRYRETLVNYRNKLQTLPEYLEKKGENVILTKNEFRIGNNGSIIYISDDQILEKELKKNKYVELNKLLHEGDEDYKPEDDFDVTPTVDDDDTSPDVYMSGDVFVASQSYSINVGSAMKRKKTYRLTVKLVDSNGKKLTPVFKSSKKSIATVTQKGKITTKNKKGTFKITITAKEIPSFKKTFTYKVR